MYSSVLASPKVGTVLKGKCVIIVLWDHFVDRFVVGQIESVRQEGVGGISRWFIRGKERVDLRCRRFWCGFFCRFCLFVASESWIHGQLLGCFLGDGLRRLVGGHFRLWFWPAETAPEVPPMGADKYLWVEASALQQAHVIMVRAGGEGTTLSDYCAIRYWFFTALPIWEPHLREQQSIKKKASPAWTPMICN